MVEGIEIPSRPKGGASVAATHIRERWRMGPEARALMLVSAVLMSFGLAVLYSASAFIAVQEHKGNSAFFLTRQLGAVAAGFVVFAIAAKFDAERLREWAWPIMWFTLATMLAVLVLPEKI